ncbi:hypothetical protein [Legionella taurinensis]|nr:hypothetical protein [Legionella taurinensis]MDX1836959.1 hypothetical protein [Legionella taurinensis]
MPTVTHASLSGKGIREKSHGYAAPTYPVLSAQAANLFDAGCSPS